MNDFLKILLNIRSLRAALRELSFEQLVEVREKFEEIFAEREQQETREFNFEVRHSPMPPDGTLRIP